MAYLQKKDIFKMVMWYTLAGSNKQYPLSIDRVKEIKALNAKGEKPEDLGAVELELKKGVVAEEAYVDLVGAISLKSLEKADRKSKSRNNNQGNKKPNPNNNANRGPRPEGNANKPANNGPLVVNADGSVGAKPTVQAPKQNKPQSNANNKPQGNRPPNQKPNPNQHKGPRPVGNAENNAAPKAAPQILAPKPAANPNAAAPKPAGESSGKPQNNSKFKSDFGGKKPPKPKKE